MINDFQVFELHGNTVFKHKLWQLHDSMLAQLNVIIYFFQRCNIF